MTDTENQTAPAASVPAAETVAEQMPAASEGIAKVVEIANRIIADVKAGTFRGLAIACVSDAGPCIARCSGVFIDTRDHEAASVLARELRDLEDAWLNDGGVLQ